MNYRRLEDRLKSPDNWHMPAAYWFWHHLPDTEQIRRQVREMKAAGINSFQVQARMAYEITGYLDDAYLAACKIAVEEAAKLGMMVGVYDDYNWQTGHAGGRAVAGHDHLRERQMFWTTGTLLNGRVELDISDIHSSTESMGAPGMAWHYDRSAVEWDDWEIPFVFAQSGESVLDLTSQATVTEARVDGVRVNIETSDLADGTTITAFVAARCATSRLVNFLDSDAVNRFITAGYEPFHRELGKYFGSTITYFFFDQPHENFYRWSQHHGDLRSAIPFHSDLPGRIRSQWPADYGEVLLSLLEGDAQIDRARRARFYDFFSKHSMETFLGPLHEWTTARNVKLSGHEVLAHVGKWDLSGAFDEWDLRINFGLDYFGIDSYRDLTGVDAQDGNPQLSAKFGDSVARSNGRSGTILEQYYAQSHTGSGNYSGHWGLTLEELRAQSFRHHILGMRQLLFHGYYQTDGFDNDPTMFSNPRFDFPPGQNYEPWFVGHHADFAIESGRLSEFLDGVDPVCDVAVLYPLRTVWTDGQNGPHAREGGAWYENLARAGYGYHLIDERDLLEANLRAGKLWIGDRGYSTLILPGVTTLQSNETLAFVRDASIGNVRIVASGGTPNTYQTGSQTVVEDWHQLLIDGLVTYVPNIPERDALHDVIGYAAAGAVQFDIDMSSSVWTWSGRADAHWRAVAFNDGDSPARVGIKMPEGTAAINRIDVSTGNIRKWSAQSAFSVDLEPMEIALFISGEFDSQDIAEPDHVWSAPEQMNDPWLLRIPDGEVGYARSTFPIDPTTGWEQQGLPDFSGIGIYVYNLELSEASDLRIILPKLSGAATLTVNGVAQGRRGWSPFRFDVLADDLRTGNNLIEISIASTAANRYYAGTGMRELPEPAGLLAVPEIRFIVKSKSVATGRSIDA